MKKRLYLITITILFAALLGLLCGCDSSQYKQALTLFEQEQYEDAMAIFTELGEYADVENKVVDCKYFIACSRLEQEEYKSALSYFEQLDDYEDALEKADECKYYLAQAAADNDDWETAIAMLDGVEFEDSEELLEIYETEYGMTTHADYDFLADLEKSVLARMNSDSNDYSTLVNIELAYLDKYTDANFYNTELGSLARLYIDALYEQRDALSYQYFDYQYHWQEGRMYRFSTLSRLYEKYGFLEDNAEFIATYVMESDNERNKFQGYCDISQGLENQFGNMETWETDGYSIYTTFHNGTDYTFSGQFYGTFYNEAEIKVGDAVAVVENILPDTDYQIRLWPSCGLDNASTADLDFELYDIS